MASEVYNQIFKILIKKHFSRDPPLQPKNLIKIIEKNVQQNKPIPLIGFWGIGPKSYHNIEDEKTCKFLNKLNLQIKEIYPPGIQFIFIFADMHGIHNKILKITIESYVEDMKILFRKYKFQYLFLNELWGKYNLTPNKINQILKKKKAGGKILKTTT